MPEPLCDRCGHTRRDHRSLPMRAVDDSFLEGKEKSVGDCPGFVMEDQDALQEYVAHSTTSEEQAFLDELRPTGRVREIGE